MVEPGELLRTLRMERGKSLTKLAQEANYNKGYLSKIENGSRPLSTDVARVLDRILETDGQLFRAVLPKKLPEDTSDPDDEPRDLGTGGFGVIRMDSGPLAAVRVLPNSWDVDEVAYQYTAMFLHLRGMGHQLSPAFVIPGLGTAFDQLLFVHNESDSPELLRIACRIAEYNGWMYQEAGKIDLARFWTDRAVTLSTRLGDESMRAYAYVRSAEMALYEGDPYGIVEMARAAAADPAASSAVRSLAAQREADGHAMLGDITACLSALDTARALLERSERETGPQYGTTSLVDPIATSRGWAMLHVAPDESAELLAAAVAAIPTTSVRSRGRFGVRLARAHVERGDVESACAVLTGLIADLGRTDSATVRVDLRHLSTALVKHHAHPAVKEVHPRISELLRLRR